MAEVEATQYRSLFGDALQLVQLSREGVVDSKTASYGVRAGGYPMTPGIYQELLDGSLSEGRASSFTRSPEKYGIEQFLGALAAHFALNDVQVDILRDCAERDILVHKLGMRLAAELFDVGSLPDAAFVYLASTVLSAQGAPGDSQE